MKAYKLVLINESNEIDSWKIQKNIKYLIGRNPDKSDIKISDSFVSRIHAEVYLNEENGLTIKDLDSCKDSLISANGTLIDGKKISPRQNTKLKHNNKVSFGDSKKYLIVKELTKDDTQKEERNHRNKETKTSRRTKRSRSRQKVNYDVRSIYNNNSFYSKQNEHVFRRKETEKNHSNRHTRKEITHNAFTKRHHPFQNDLHKIDQKNTMESKLNEYLKLKTENKSKDLKQKEEVQGEHSEIKRVSNHNELRNNIDTVSEKQKVFFKEFQSLRNKSK